MLQLRYKEAARACAGPSSGPWRSQATNVAVFTRRVAFRGPRSWFSFSSQFQRALEQGLELATE